MFESFTNKINEVLLAALASMGSFFYWYISKSDKRLTKVEQEVYVIKDIKDDIKDIKLSLIEENKRLREVIIRLANRSRKHDK